MWVVREITRGKAKFARQLIKALPQWFVHDKANERYIRATHEQTLLAAGRDSDEVIGILSLRLGSESGAEIALLGVTPTYHRQGCGTALINSAEIMAGDRGYRYLFVETLPASEVSTVYDGTRKFYAGLGFDSLTRLVDYWGKGKDCLLMLKSIEAYPVSDKRRLVGVVGASRSPQTGAKRRKHPSR